MGRRTARHVQQRLIVQTPLAPLRALPSTSSKTRRLPTSAFWILLTAKADGIFSTRRLSLNIPGVVLEIATKLAIPTIFGDEFFVERGGLVSYSANRYQLGHQAARLVDKIIKGVKPADIPVEQPTKFELVINMKTAKALGIKIPNSILVRADKVIE